MALLQGTRMYDEDLIRQLKVAAMQAFPEEMCGFVLSDNSFVRCDNISDNPTMHFSISPIDIHKYIADAKYIVHSHTSKRLLHICTPSLTDIETQKRWQLPFLIVGYDGSVFTEPVRLPSIRNNNYIDRPYIYGIQDCGVLLMDYYFFTFGIQVDVPPEYSLYAKKDWTKAILQGLTDNAFVKQEIGINELRQGDILLVSVLGGLANHALIYVGENIVLNQGEVSLLESLAVWSDNIHSIYRHSQLC